LCLKCGRASDRHITLNSGFIDLIDHGDQIMADRGFLVKEEIMIKRATLIIQPAAQGAEQCPVLMLRQRKKLQTWGYILRELSRG
jgi:hypothetical protein